MLVKSNEQLEDIYKEHLLSQENKVPRFEVVVNPYLNNMNQF